MQEEKRPPEATLQEILAGFEEAALERTKGQDAIRPVCVLCRLITRSIERALRSLFFEFVNDPALRKEFRGARGFCPQHTPLLATLGDAVAVAILYSDLADQTRMRWEATNGRRTLLRGRRPVPLAPCLACQAAQDGERRYTAAFALGLETEAFWEVLTVSDGLCTAHTEKVAAVARPFAAARLRRQEAERLAVLQAELEEIIRKNDYRFRGEPWGAEKDAWLRALRKLSR